MIMNITMMTIMMTITTNKILLYILHFISYLFNYLIEYDNLISFVELHSALYRVVIVKLKKY